MKRILQILVISSLVMLLIPDFHPERLYSNGYHEWLDVLQHSGYFLAFTLAALWVFPLLRRFFPYYFLIIGVSVLLEILQLWVPNRSFAYMDMLSNITGISFAYLLRWIFDTLRARRGARA